MQYSVKEPFKIEVATATHDLKKVTSVINAAYKKARFLRDGIDRVSCEEVEELLLDPLKKLYLCISPAGEICGTILLKFIDKNKAEISLFSIHPDYQGKKIGPMFMQYVEKEAFKKAYEIILEVISFYQENLVKFYEKLGYAMTGQTLQFSEEASLRYIRPECRDQIFISIMSKKAGIFKLKQDSFRKARGGYSRFLNIYCQSCLSHVLLYQKDGPGPLKRLYVDRIIAPNFFIDDKSPLVCNFCKALLATPYVYEKEERPALLIKEKALVKKLTKGEFPSFCDLKKD